MSLERFVLAQAPLLDDIERELTQGQKVTHWMWYVFPQLAGLGKSAMARRYALADAAEAMEYLAHGVLGPRLRHHTALVNQSQRSIDAIFGFPDNLKFHSCMTLFEHVGPGDIFPLVIEQRFGGVRDENTLRLLRQ